MADTGIVSEQEDDLLLERRARLGRGRKIRERIEECLGRGVVEAIFDFDRDDSTGTVFMTMEVMIGQPMDAFMRKLPADGLPEEEAMPLIEQLSQGLAYAQLPLKNRALSARFPVRA